MIPATIQRHAREKGGALAYWTPQRTWSFAQVEEAACRVAAGLRSLGIGPGDRVACLTKLTAECVALVLGANKVGAVCMPVNWRLAPPEIEYIVNNGEAKLMLCDRGFSSAFEQVKAPTINSPAEVENALMQHPAVADGAVIGVPDEQWGESVKACVVLKADLLATEKEIIEFMRERIAHFKCPKSVDFIDAIPRNPTGKILKRVLREPYWKGKERRVN